VVGILGSYMDHIICHEQKYWARENSAEALADAIMRWPVEKSIGSRAAKRTASFYSWARVFEELFCIYRDVRSNYRRF
jgi:hypothetical protein